MRLIAEGHQDITC